MSGAHPSDGPSPDPALRWKATSIAPAARAALLGAAIACGAQVDAASPRPSGSGFGQEEASELESSEAVRLWESGDRLAAVALLEEELAQTATADSLRRLTTWQLAIHRYNAALATARRGSFVRLQGEALYALTRYEEALEHLDPDHPPHALWIVDANEAIGRVDEADAALDRASRLLGTSDSRLHTFRGRSLGRKGDHRAALAEFDRALGADPLDQTALFGRGRALVQLGQRDEGLAVLGEHRRRAPLIDALEFARQSLDLSPRSASNLAQVGDALRALEQWETALAHYQSALDLAAPNERVAISQRTARLLEVDLGRVDDALARLDADFALTRDPRLAVRAGDVARRAQRWSAALDRYRRALAIRPTDRAILDRIAVVEQEQGR